ncbi:phosphoadenosine phosphosulfate reductase domain-containing protein [Stetteria hydrogenophila]
MARRSLRKAWPVVNRVYWCPGSNVPSLGKECGDGSEAFEVRLTEPGDARPAMEHDFRNMEKGYRRETGSTRGFNRLLGAGVKVVNKVPFMDAMYEVVSEGVVIGRYYFDPLTMEWRFRFAQPGLLRVWDLEPLPKFKLEGGVKALLKRRVYRNTINAPPLSQVVFVDENDYPVGLGYVSEDGEVVKTHSIYRRPQPASRSSRVNSTWDDAIKVNDYYIYYYKSRALKFIHVMVEKVKKPVLVSFSGGKDSLVALHLTLEAGYRPTLIFNDTGIEMPETIKAVEEVSKTWGLEVLVASAGDSFWRGAELVGPPGKDYRWCCKVAKLAPLARLLKEKYPDGAINIVGQRAFESLDRARSPRVWRNKWFPTILNISPVQEWSQLLVWLYIWKHKLPYNPLYDMGFDRIGCFMCPAGNLAEYEVVKETHPELWSKWEEFLERWATQRLGFTREQARLWVERGLWRWLSDAPQKLRLARRIGFKAPDWREVYRRWLKPGLLEYKAEEGVARVVFKDSIKAEALDDQYPVMGAFTRRGRGSYTLGRLGNVEVRASGNSITVKGLRGVAARELVFDAAKLMYRWVNCIGCRLCELSCPTGAIRVVSEDGALKPKVNPSTCIHCKLCLDNCPVADVSVEHIAIALALDNPTAWRRSGKRTRESIVARYLKLHKFKLPTETPSLEEDVLVAPPSLEDTGGGS